MLDVWRTDSGGSFDKGKWQQAVGSCSSLNQQALVF